MVGDPDTLGFINGHLCLDNPGYQYLTQAGLQPAGRFRASELAQREFAFLRHHLQANDLLVLAERLSEQYQGVSIARMKTDRQLRREPVLIGSHDGQRAVVPDGWVDVRIGTVQHCVAFELDGGTERRKKIKRKVQDLLDYSQGPYQSAFGTQSLTIAFVVAQGGSGRADELLRWIEAVLEERGRRQDADLFRVACFDPACIEPEQAFFGAMWRRPFSLSLVPLIGGVNA